MRLKGKVAFITGATSGIGEVMARRFAEEGAKVVLAARSEEKGRAIAASICSAGADAMYLRMDVSKEDNVQNAVAHAVERYGSVHVLVNNAGPVDLMMSGTDRPADRLETAAFDAILKTALYGPFWCCKYVLPHMMTAGTGSIVNISSTAAVIGLPAMPAYSAAKGGLSALTRQLAVDYGAHAIRANAIVVGFIVHENTQGRIDTPEKKQAYQKLHLTRLGVPQDVVNAALYLASDESVFVTGSHLAVDGGVLVKSR